MIMKDKLERNNHTKIYYFFKKVFLSSLGIFGAFVLLAIPISIIESIYSSKNEELKNDDVTQENILTNIVDNYELLKY